MMRLHSHRSFSQLVSSTLTPKDLLLRLHMMDVCLCEGLSGKAQHRHSELDLYGRRIWMRQISPSAQIARRFLTRLLPALSFPHFHAIQCILCADPSRLSGQSSTVGGFHTCKSTLL
jgi:hypothetical protein